MSLSAVIGVVALVVRESLATDENNGEDRKRDGAGAEGGGLPRKKRCQSHHKEGTDRPTDVARDAVPGKAVSEPGFGNVVVDETVVGRMKDTVAGPRAQGRGDKRRVVDAGGQKKTRNAQESQPDEEGKARAEFVGEDAACRLTESADKEKRRRKN